MSGKRFNYIINSDEAYQQLSTGNQNENLYNINFSNLNKQKKYKVDYNIYSRHTASTSVNQNIVILIDFGSNAYQYNPTSTIAYPSTLVSGGLYPVLTSSNFMKIVSGERNNGKFMINCPNTNLLRIKIRGAGGDLTYNINQYIMLLSLEEMDEEV